MRAYCAVCEDKEEQIAYLKSELGEIKDMVEVHDLRKAFGFRGLMEAKIILRLIRNRHHALTRDQLADELPRGGTNNGVNVYISRIRTALGHDTIETLWGGGFRITKEGLARYEAFKKDMT